MYMVIDEFIDASNRAQTVEDLFDLYKNAMGVLGFDRIVFSLMTDHALIRWVFAAQVAFYGMALLGLVLPLRHFGKLFNLPLYFCTGNAAVMMSVIEAMRGNQFAVWETVRK